MKTNNNTDNKTAYTNECSGTEEEISSSIKECTSCEQKNDNDDAPCNLLKNDTSTTDVPSTVSTCANCGKEGSDVKNNCNKCQSVKYCNAACKKKHRHKHKKDCEEHVRRAAEQAAKLHDEKLFKQPPLLYGDCPICFLRMPSLISGSTYMACCGKVICNGCIHAVKTRTEKRSLCAFCRTPNATSKEKDIERMKKRVETGDPIAIYNIGNHCSRRSYGCPLDYTKALEFWQKAGDLGYAPAYTNIGYAYDCGEGIEVDKMKAEHYYELAAMDGNEVARHNLGCMEERKGRMDRALKHFMIAVGGGWTGSLKSIQRLYSNGHATKDDYSKALSAYQAYLNEIKSAQREASVTCDDYKYY